MDARRWTPAAAQTERWDTDPCCHLARAPGDGPLPLPGHPPVSPAASRDTPGALPPAVINTSPFDNFVIYEGRREKLVFGVKLKG